MYGTIKEIRRNGDDLKCTRGHWEQKRNMFHMKQDTVQCLLAIFQQGIELNYSTDSSPEEERISSSE